MKIGKYAECSKIFLHNKIHENLAQKKFCCCYGI